MLFIHAKNYYYRKSAKKARRECNNKIQSTKETLCHKNSLLKKQ